MTNDVKLSEKILELAKKTSFETLEELIEPIKKELGISDELALKYFIELENQGKLRLSSPSEFISTNFYTYLFSIHAIWFWIIMALSVSTTITILAMPENAYLYVYIRYILGALFILYLPGFSLIKTLFPTREIENIERVALSIVMSIVIIPLIGLLLNYTPWGIRITSVTLSLLIFIIALSIIGLIREHSEKTKG